MTQSRRTPGNRRVDNRGKRATEQTLLFSGGDPPALGLSPPVCLGTPPSHHSDRWPDPPPFLPASSFMIAVVSHPPHPLNKEKKNNGQRTATAFPSTAPSGTRCPHHEPQAPSPCPAAYLRRAVPAVCCMFPLFSAERLRARLPCHPERQDGQPSTRQLHRPPQQNEWHTARLLTVVAFLLCVCVVLIPAARPERAQPPRGRQFPARWRPGAHRDGLTARCGDGLVGRRFRFRVSCAAFSLFVR